MRRDEFVARYGGLYEASPWVAERAWDGGVGEDDDLAARLREVVERAGAERQLALLRAHPDLAGRVGVDELAAASAEEQRGAGLDNCSPEEAQEFLALNADYTHRFGFPFILAVRGRSRGEILERFRARVANAPQEELRTALDEVHAIARLRLAAMEEGGAAPEGESVTHDELARLTRRALERAGADEATVAGVTDTVMAAETGGSRSHGMFRVPGYCHALASGLVNAAPQVTVREEGAVVKADGGGGFAPVAYRTALPALAERAEAMGAAVLALTNVYHLAAMWHEVEFFARRGLAAFACTANFAYLAPHGGTRALFGTNPIAFAYPHEPHPLAFDFASSAMARGDILLAQRDGRRVPAGVGIDETGVPTRDPAKILAGAQLAFGGHKGSAIALMVELLCGGIVGDAFSDEVDPDESGAPPGGIFILALSPRAIGGNETQARAARFLERVAAEPGVRLPGARRHRARGGSEAVVPATLLAKLRELAGEAT